jgi:hypothetical protein
MKNDFKNLALKVRLYAGIYLILTFKTWMSTLEEKKIEFDRHLIGSSNWVGRIVSKILGNYMRTRGGEESRIRVK